MADIGSLLSTFRDTVSFSSSKMNSPRIILCGLDAVQYPRRAEA
jgi:hypothetical protein